MITAFAVLHHIPSHELRLEILRVVNQLLKKDGLLIHSNWQFLNSEKLKARIQPWEAVNLSAFKCGLRGIICSIGGAAGQGLRYVHHFDETGIERTGASQPLQDH